MGDILGDFKKIDDEEGSYSDDKDEYFKESPLDKDVPVSEDEMAEDVAPGKKDAPEPAASDDQRKKMLPILAAAILLIIGGLLFWKFFPYETSVDVTPVPSFLPDKFYILAQVLDEKSIPLPQANLSLSSTATGIDMGSVTDNKGIARFTLNYDPKEVTIVAKKDGYETGYQTVSVTNQTMKVVINLKVKSASYTPDKTVNVIVTTTYKGNPAPATVILSDSSSGVQIATGQTDPNSGTAKISVSSGATFDVQAYDSSSRFAKTQSPVTAYEGLEIPLELADPKATVSVKVTESLNGAAVPVSAALVTALDANGKETFEAYTDSTGTAKIGGDAPATVYAYKEGYLPNSASVNGQASVSITILAATTDNAYGVFAFAANSGSPVASANVQMAGQNGQFIGYPQKITDASGKASFEVAKAPAIALTAKGYWGGVSAASYPPAMPAEGEVYTVDFAGSNKGGITYNITDTSGKPISNATVNSFLASAPGSAADSCVTDNNGSCTFLPSSVTNYFASAQAAGFYDYTTEIFRPSPTKNTVVSMRLESDNGLQYFPRFIGLYKPDGTQIDKAGQNTDYNAKFAVSTNTNEMKLFYDRLGNNCALTTEPAKFSQPKIGESSQSGTVSLQIICNQGTNTSADPDWVSGEFPRSFRGTTEVLVPIITKSLQGNKTNESVPMYFTFMQYPDANFSTLEGNAKFYTAYVNVTLTGQTCANNTCFGAAVLNSTGQPVSSFIQNDTGNAVASGNISGAYTLEVASGGLEFSGKNAINVSLTGDVFSATVPFVAKNKGLYWPVRFIVHARDGKELSRQLVLVDVTGNQTITNVNISPGSIPMLASVKAWANATGASSQPVANATVSFYDCSGNPLGNDISAAETPASSGKYTALLTPGAQGKIGVRIRQSDFRLYENCAINVTQPELVSITPDSLDFTASPQPDPMVTAKDIAIYALSLTATATCSGNATINVTPAFSALSPNGTTVFAISSPKNETYSGMNICNVRFDATNGTITQQKDVAVTFADRIPILCYDSDGGKNFTIKGNVTYDGILAGNDTCIDTHNLTEWYCNQSKMPDSVNQTCDKGCYDGACLNRTCIGTCPDLTVSSIDRDYVPASAFSKHFIISVCNNGTNTSSSNFSVFFNVSDELGVHSMTFKGVNVPAPSKCNTLNASADNQFDAPLYTYSTLTSIAMAYANFNRDVTESNMTNNILLANLPAECTQCVSDCKPVPWIGGQPEKAETMNTTYVQTCKNDKCDFKEALCIANTVCSNATCNGNQWFCTDQDNRMKWMRSDAGCPNDFIHSLADLPDIAYVDAYPGDKKGVMILLTDFPNETVQFTSPIIKDGESGAGCAPVPSGLPKQYVTSTLTVSFDFSACDVTQLAPNMTMNFTNYTDPSRPVHTMKIVFNMLGYQPPTGMSSQCLAYHEMLKKYWLEKTNGCMAIPYALLERESGCNDETIGDLSPSRAPMPSPTPDPMPSGSYSCGLTQINSASWPSLLIFPPYNPYDPSTPQVIKDAGYCFNANDSIHQSEHIYYDVNSPILKNCQKLPSPKDLYCAYNSGASNGCSGNCDAGNMAGYQTYFDAIKRQYKDACTNFDGTPIELSGRDWCPFIGQSCPTQNITQSCKSELYTCMPGSGGLVWTYTPLSGNNPNPTDIPNPGLNAGDQGADVSTYQGNIDWTVAKTKIKFAMIKASEGTSLTDTQFASNWANSNISGVKRGAYHYFRSDMDGAAQAQFFANTIGGKDYNGELPPCVDVEANDGSLSKTQYATQLSAFLTACNADTGRNCGVYSAPGPWSAYVGPITGVENHPLWVATWQNSHYVVPSPWSGKTPFVWQWAGDQTNGSLYGASGGIDLDVYVSSPT